MLRCYVAMIYEKINGLSINRNKLIKIYIFNIPSLSVVRPQSPRFFAFIVESIEKQRILSTDRQIWKTRFGTACRIAN